MPVDWLNPDLVELKVMQGERLEPGQCYSYKIPPILGGPLASSNVGATDLLVHFSIAGQLHRQVKDLPPGTKITNVNIVEPGSAKGRSGTLTRLLERTRKLGLRLRSRAAE